MRRSALPDIERILSVSGGELGALRRAQGLSRDDLAELTGLHRNTIANVERGGSDSSILAMSLMQVHLRASGVVVGREGFILCHPQAPGREYPYPDLLVRPSTMMRVMGEMVRQRRVDRGMSIADFAVAAGVHRNTVWNIERGLVVPTSSTIYLIYRGLGVQRVGGSGDGPVLI
jgi:transcriptional regulator with XRE-family HTH domain